METAALVDYLAAQLCCDYISDLRFLTPLDRVRAAGVLKHLSPADWPLGEWNDALAYIARKQAAATAEEAYQALLLAL